MPFARRIQNPEGLYFVTFATVQWRGRPCGGVFTRSTYVDILLESLRYCQKEKGLRIHAWCVMSNHVHLMISTQFGYHPSDALRDLKKFTSKKIIAAIADKEQPESRRGWMLWIFSKRARTVQRIRSISFGSRRIILLS